MISFDYIEFTKQVVGEKNVMVFLADVDHLKMEKIKEAMEKAVLLDAKGNPRTGGGGGGAAAAAAPAAPAKGWLFCDSSFEYSGVMTYVKLI